MYQIEFENWNKYQAPTSNFTDLAPLRADFVRQQYLEKKQELRLREENERYLQRKNALKSRWSKLRADILRFWASLAQHEASRAR